MDFHWFFKRRPNGPNNSDYFSGEGIPGDDSRDEDFQSFDVPFVDQFESIERRAQDMFKHMDEMMSQMFSSITPFGNIRREDFFSNDEDPRSLMLKEPDDSKSLPHPFIQPFGIIESDNFVDNDIDDEVAKHGLILDDNMPNYKIPQTFSFKRFSSIRTIRSSDGTIEEHCKKSDSNGNVINIVRRTIGDQCHEVTTHEDKQGVKETQENLLNLEENELFNFEKRWQDLKSKPRELYLPKTDFLVPESIPSVENVKRELYQPEADALATKLTPPVKDSLKLSPSFGDPSYLSIFKKIFGF